MPALKLDECGSPHRIPLVERGSMQRTFRGVGLFAEAGLLFCGSYLIADALLEPLNAGVMSVLGGSLFLACAVFLLAYLVRPSFKRSRSRTIDVRPYSAQTALTSYGQEMQKRVTAAQELRRNSSLPGPM